jgi:hypothetical protein
MVEMGERSLYSGEVRAEAVRKGFRFARRLRKGEESSEAGKERVETKDGKLRIKLDFSHYRESRKF